VARTFQTAILLVPFSLFAAGDPDQPAGIAELRDMSLEALMEVKIVSAARREQRAVESPRSVSVLTAEEIRRRNYRTVPEALNEMMGILVQETNYGGGAPIIRGMVGNRVLLLVDGIRLSNSLYRMGPVQYLNTIDLYQVERIEVVRGPSSALYGSDALGGLVNIVTRSPETEKSGSSLHTILHSRFSSADRASSGRLGFNGHVDRLGFTGGISPKNFGDLRAGRATSRQLSSGYEESDGDLKLAYAASERHRIEFLASKSHQRNISRTDLLVSGVNLRYEIDPQDREMAAFRYSGQNLARWAETAQITVSHQLQTETLFSMAASQPGAESRSDDGARTLGIIAELGARIGEKQRLTYGYEVYRDTVDSHRLIPGPWGGAATWQRGAHPDGTRAANSAGFVQLETQLSERLAATLGMRYSRFSIHSELIDPSRGLIRLNLGTGDWTPSTAVSASLGAGLTLVGGISKGFRAPNVDDATILELTGTRLELPNPDLRPETALNYETGLRMERKWLAASVTGFRTSYANLIERGPAIMQGVEWLDENGDGIRDRNEPGFYQRQNIGRALVEGVETEAEVRLNERWSLRANTSWIRGEDRVASSPLSRIPPVKGLAAVRWRPFARFWAEGYALAAGRQARLSPGDRSDRRITPGGTPGFATWNVRGGADLPRGGMLTLGFENLADRRYRWHGSGIDAPGRNLVAGVGWAF